MTDTHPYYTGKLTHTSRELDHCPACRSEDISYRDGFCDGIIHVVCNDCNARWDEAWTYAGIVMIEGKVKV
tara:strand:- start:10049 stop:10261 length:213 start_codon:yes stop_codon:yes gene_type:complete